MSSHSHDLSPWQHSHVFDSGNERGESRTRWVLLLTIVMMVAEIAAGWWTGSMALLADGWHMGTHALALGVATAAYALARRHAGDRRYTFGTWKIEVLGGYSSAMVLGLVAIGIGFESAMRLYRSEPIEAQTALWVAVIGLVVNLVSAWLLHGAQHEGHGHGGHSHGHGHGHSHGHGHAHRSDHSNHSDHADHAGHDHHADHAHDSSHAHAAPPPAATTPAKPAHDVNLQAAYVHVLADALTSVLAIGALAAAVWLGWWWLDPVVGLLGAGVIAVWAVGLLRESSAVLLDREMDLPLAQAVRNTLESDGDAKVADLHVWRVGRDKFAAIACLVADAPLAPAVYRARLAVHPELAHVSLEVNSCPAAGR